MSISFNRQKGSAIALFSVLLFFPLHNLQAAGVKPLEVLSEKIIVSEIEHLATENSLNATLLRKSVDRLNREMNVMSKPTARESLLLLTAVAEKLAAAEKSSSALSSYLTANSASLKSAGHERYLPLASMDKEIERDYFKSLATFLKTAFAFVTFCHENFDAISSGKNEATKRYDELYASYQKDMERFNSQSIARSQLLTEMGTEYPSLWELMPR